jgi:hypothetical protein
MRFRAVAQAAENAGISVPAHDIEKWIAGATLPPRHLSGLNDPIHITVAASYLCDSLALGRCALHAQACKIWDPVFQARKEMMHWAEYSYDLYTPIWRSARDICNDLNLAASPKGLAKAHALLLEKIQLLQDNQIVSHQIGDQHASKMTPTAWLAGLFTPYLIQKSGLTDVLIPNMVLPVRFLDHTTSELTADILAMMTKEALVGLDELNRLERQFENANSGKICTKRSRYRSATKFMLALPSVNRRRLSAALGTTPQGTGYLLRKMKETGPEIAY